MSGKRNLKKKPTSPNAEQAMAMVSEPVASSSTATIEVESVQKALVQAYLKSLERPLEQCDRIQFDTSPPATKTILGNEPKYPNTATFHRIDISTSDSDRTEKNTPVGFFRNGEFKEKDDELFYRVQLRSSSLILSMAFVDLMIGHRIPVPMVSRDGQYHLSLDKDKYALASIHYRPMQFHYVCNKQTKKRSTINNSSNTSDVNGSIGELVEMLSNDGLTSIHHVIQTEDSQTKEQLIIDVAGGELAIGGGSSSPLVLVMPVQSYMREFNHQQGEITDYVRAQKRDLQNERLNHAKQMKDIFNALTSSPFPRSKIVCKRCGCEEDENIKIKPCSRCRTTAYCSKICQKLDWKLHKTLECISQQPIVKEAVVPVDEQQTTLNESDFKGNEQEVTNQS